MNNFVEHVLTFTTQADADDIHVVPVDTQKGPVSLESVMVYLTAVAGSPTAVTLDLDITDGSTTKAAIAAQSIGTAAGKSRLVPTAQDLEDGDHNVPQDDGSDWRYEIDLNFTGGTSPTVTGKVVVRWAV